MTADQKELTALHAMREEVRLRLLEVPDYVKWVALNAAIRVLEPKTTDVAGGIATKSPPTPTG